VTKQDVTFGGAVEAYDFRMGALSYCREGEIRKVWAERQAPYHPDATPPPVFGERINDRAALSVASGAAR
jgi:hypothetical protein